MKQTDSVRQSDDKKEIISPALLELSPFEEKLTELILDAPSPGKHCARSAIRHIRKAWEIKDIDAEMAAFRAYTAEEEGASAIFHSIKQWKYDGADKLDPRNHIQKAALSPFLAAVGVAVVPVSAFQIHLRLNESGPKPRLVVSLLIESETGEKGYLTSDPPLHFSLDVNGKKHDFTEQLEEVAKTKNVEDVIKYVRSAANMRNRILYASTEGIPTIVKPLDAHLIRQKDRVFAFVALFLMIDPYPEHQLFVQQTLNAFLKMLGKLPDESYFQ